MAQLQLAGFDVPGAGRGTKCQLWRGPHRARSATPPGPAQVGAYVPDVFPTRSMSKRFPLQGGLGGVGGVVGVQVRCWSWLELPSWLADMHAWERAC